MLRGTLLAESLRIGAALDVAGLRVTRLIRRDVAASVTAAQPVVWTFLDFQADDEVAGPLARALAEALLADGGWYADFTVGDDHVVVFAGPDLPLPPRRPDRPGRRGRVRPDGRRAGPPAGLGGLSATRTGAAAAAPGAQRTRS